MEKQFESKKLSFFEFWNSERKSISKKDVYATFLGGAFIGFIIFVIIYGVQVLNPMNDRWIYINASDFSQAYNGWLLYRKTPWSFPLGYVDGMYYQTQSVTVISTDSIPIFALLFKLLSPILPETFQYFGIWELLCFCLQGGFGALLLRKKIPYNLVAVLGSYFMVIASWFISRVFGHCALSGQFIVLAAWCLWAYDNTQESILKKILKWGGVCSVAILIAPYFAIMTGGLMMGSTLHAFLKKKKSLEFIVPLGCVVITALSFALMGGFYGVNSGINNHLLGQSSVNLNAWFDPQGRSRFLPTLPEGDIYFPHEGLQYLGLGIILLIPFAVIYLVSYVKRFINFEKQQKKAALICLVPLFIVCAAFGFFSAFPYFRLGDRIIFSIEMPEKLYNLFDIFQSNGRFFWVISYGVTAFLLLSYAKFWEMFRVTKKIIPILLIPIMVVQWIDQPILQIYSSQYQHVDEITEEQTILPQSAIWDEVFAQADYLDFLWGWDVANTQALVPKAAQYGVKMNISQAARQSIQQVAEYAAKTTTELIAGVVPERKVYVIQNLNYILANLITQEKLRFFHEDGYYLVVPRDIEIQGGYSELELASYNISEYGNILKKLDEKHVVLISSFGASEKENNFYLTEMLQTMGYRDIPDLSKSEFAVALAPATGGLEYAVGQNDAVLTFDRGDRLGNISLSVPAAIAGGASIDVSTQVEMGATINSHHVMFPLHGGTMVYVYNAETGIVESIAWTTGENTEFVSIENLYYPVV